MGPARRLLVLMLVALAACPFEAMAASRDRYERVLAQEQKLRLDGPRPSPLSHMRRTYAAYEAVARRYPSSGYADNALFQGAGVARAAHRVYGSTLDRDEATRLLQWLIREYPSSSLRPRARTMLDSLSPTRVARKAAPAAAAAVTPTAARSASPPPAPVARPTAASLPMATLRDVRREMIGSVVRVTLVFDGEVSYQQEELANPSRLYFDLDRTTPGPGLSEATLSFEGPTGRHIRLGRPKEQMTRVVIDTQGSQRHSVFALYNPFRLAIDLAPTPPPMLSARVVAPAAAPATADPAPVPVSTLVRREPERLTRRPLPHPLADRPLRAPTGAPPTDVAAAMRPPVLSARPLLATSAPALRPIPGRAVSPPIYALIAAARAKPATPLARRIPTPPIAPAPDSPAPNSLGGYSLARQLGLGVSRIVIDPGHGGHDPGAMANRTNEAEIVLDVALRLEKLLLKEPGVEVVLTRRTNVFIPLEERPAIANREGADLFLSIHVNSSRNTRASGVETYFLNFANNAEAEAVAARENATAARSMHQLPDMVKAISQNNKLDESRDFARTVQESLVAGYDRDEREARDRGVKHAPFVVLIGANMPSVLAEIAFLTNAEEGSRLRRESHRQRIAQSLFEALRTYQRSLKAVGTVASQ